ncbi:laccase domain protein [Alphaproteobacteria bacterium]|nr:laccase domain protein [Alphaproteobacteria bacterium]
MIPPVIRDPHLSALPLIRHGFFTRQGGASVGIYASLNCGPGSEDDHGAVFENQGRVAKSLGFAPESLARLHQIHGSEVVTLGDDWRQTASPPAADAMATRTPGILLGILTADCAPVLLVDPKARVIGAAHSGWRGAVSGVLEKLVARMVDLGAKPDRIVAAIGPSIAQASYEVGDEFVAAFPKGDAFFVRNPRTGRAHFDLPGFAAARLSALGLAAVAQTGGDTAREEDRFFSYRRATLKGEADYGRQLSVIGLAENGD